MTKSMLAILCFYDASAHADNGFTYHSSILERENPDSIGLAGVSVVRMGAGFADTAAALPLQKNTLQFFSQIPQKNDVTPLETDSNSKFGVNLSLNIPNPLMAAGTGIKIRQSQFSSHFSPTKLNALEYQNQDTEMSASLGVLVFDELSLGLEPIFVMGDELVLQTSPWQKIEATSYHGTTGRMSAQLNLQELKLGVSWQKELIPKSQRTLIPREGSEIGTPYFPGEFRIGAGYAFPAINSAPFPLQFNILAETNFLYFTKAQSKLVRAGSRVYQRGYALYVPFDETSSEQVQELKTKARTTPRIALETTLVDINNFRCLASTGMYTAPGMLKDEKDKTHYTVGANLLLWGFRVAASMDTAENTRTYAIGLGAQYEK